MTDEKTTFTGKVQELGRVTIPQVVREALAIYKGDTVEVTIRKVSK